MANRNSSLLYGIDESPPIGETIILGFQHYLTMFGSTVAIPLLLAPALGIQDPVEKGWLIATMFFVSGITTLLQTTFGNRLPIVQGGTFSFLAPTFAILGMASLASVGWEVRNICWCQRIGWSTITICRSHNNRTNHCVDWIILIQIWRT